MSKSFGKTGLSGLVQWGKAGPYIRHDGTGLFQCQIADASTLARVQGADSVADDDFVTRRQLLASGGSTEPITATPLAPLGPPGTIAMGERAYLADAGGGGPTFAVTLPQILAGDAGVGRRCSVVLESGNPSRGVSLTAGAPGQGVQTIDGTFTPAASLSFPPGTFTGYTVLDLEAVFGAFPATPLPATVTPPLSPFEYTGPFFPLAPGVSANPAPVPVTIDGTGGTLPTVFGLDVVLTGPYDVTLTVNTATQAGGPGTAWQIQADIPANSLFGGFALPAALDLRIIDISGPPTLFAAIDNVFRVDSFPGPPPTPSPYVPIVDTWVVESNVDTSGGGGGGSRWDQSLAAGPTSDGANAYVVLEDEIVWSEAVPGSYDPTLPPTGGGPGGSPNFHSKATRTGQILAGGGFTSLGSAIHTFTGFTAGGYGNTIWLRWVGQRKRATAGVGAGVAMAVLEEIWSYDFGSWTRLETIGASAAAPLFQFAGSGTSIFIQALDDPTFDYAARGVIEWSWSNGYPPS